MQDQVGVQRLLERGRERLHQLVRQLADEADRVGEQVAAPGDLEGAGGRVERVEEAVAHAGVGAGERVQQRGLAGVGVAGQRDGRQMRALALVAHHAARWPSCARGAASARRCGRAPGGGRSRSGVSPGPLVPMPPPRRSRWVHSPRMRARLYSSCASSTWSLPSAECGVVGEDVEDDRRAVDHRHADRLLEVALLARQQLVVAGDEVRVVVLDRLLQLGELALAEVAVGVGLRAALGQLARHGHAGGAQQLAAARPRSGSSGADGDAQRALARARVAHALAVAGLCRASVSGSVHARQSRPAVGRLE